MILIKLAILLLFSLVLGSDVPGGRIAKQVHAQRPILGACFITLSSGSKDTVHFMFPSDIVNCIGEIVIRESKMTDFSSYALVCKRWNQVWSIKPLFGLDCTLAFPMFYDKFAAYLVKLVDRSKNVHTFSLNNVNYFLGDTSNFVKLLTKLVMSPYVGFSAKEKCCAILGNWYGKKREMLNGTPEFLGISHETLFCLVTDDEPTTGITDRYVDILATYYRATKKLPVEKAEDALVLFKASSKYDDIVQHIIDNSIDDKVFLIKMIILEKDDFRDLSRSKRQDLVSMVQASINLKVDYVSLMQEYEDSEGKDSSFGKLLHVLERMREAEDPRTKDFYKLYFDSEGQLIGLNIYKFLHKITFDVQPVDMNRYLNSIFTYPEVLAHPKFDLPGYVRRLYEARFNLFELFFHLTQEETVVLLQGLCRDFPVNDDQDVSFFYLDDYNTEPIMHKLLISNPRICSQTRKGSILKIWPELFGKYLKIKKFLKWNPLTLSELKDLCLGTKHFESWSESDRRLFSSNINNKEFSNLIKGWFMIKNYEERVFTVIQYNEQHCENIYQSSHLKVYLKKMLELYFSGSLKASLNPRIFSKASLELLKACLHELSDKLPGISKVRLKRLAKKENQLILIIIYGTTEDAELLSRIESIVSTEGMFDFVENVIENFEHVPYEEYHDLLKTVFKRIQARYGTFDEYAIAKKKCLQKKSD